MRLVLRRARRSRGLLVAAASAALLGTVLLTGLDLYSGQVLDSGTRAAIAAAPVQDRSLLLTGPLDDAPKIPDRLGGAPVEVAEAGYALGQQLPAGNGDAKPDADGLRFASVMYLDGLARHARLTDGGWPRAGGSRIEVALAARAARLLRLSVGDTLPLTDRQAGQTRTVHVVGVWRPADPAEPYWRLVPELKTGSLPGSATYGPFVVDRADFRRHFANLGSAGRVITPDLSRVTAEDLPGVRRDTQRLRRSLPEARVATGLDGLAQRLARTTVVARSALLVPALLLIVVVGYALLLVGALLADQREAENAVLRARGGGTVRLARLAAAEAGIVVLPALLLGPPLAAALLRLAAASPVLTRLGLHLDVRLPASAWLVSAGAALGCGLALVLPVLRGRQHLAQRRSRRGVLQRAGADLALVGLAVLAWLQLRQYGSPLLGLAVDPVLVAAPTLGVLAAAVLALRLLPLVTRGGEHVAGRRGLATLLGVWQAGRRPHAGTVLLLSLAVAVATLAICLQGTSQRSQTDQAAHRAGADLRLVETGVGDTDRGPALARTPGVETVLPAVQQRVSVGSGTSTMLLLDAGRAGAVLRPRADLTDTPAATLFDRLASGRDTGGEIPLPDNARRITGQLTVTSDRPGERAHLQITVDVRDRYGLVHHLRAERVPADDRSTRIRADGRPTRIEVTLPPGAEAVYGFRVDGRLAALGGFELTWRLSDLTAADGTGNRTPLRLGSDWRPGSETTDQAVTLSTPKPVAGDGLAVRYRAAVQRTYAMGTHGPVGYGFSLARAGGESPVGVLVTPRVLDEIGGRVGSELTLPVGGGELPAKVLGVIDAVPGVADRAAVLADLATVTRRSYLQSGATPEPTEWRLLTRPGRHQTVAKRLAKVPGTTLFDRYDVVYEPLGAGARLVLLPAALAVVLLACLGIAVDARATARSRTGELAVLHAVGTGPRLLARSLVTEQAILAGLGVLAGLGIGVLVSATMGPLLVLTPDAARPVPTPVLVADPVLLAVPVLALLAAAFGLAAAVAAGTRRDLAGLGSGVER